MSQRVLIIGVSETGKSTLARRFVREADVPVYIFDPIASEWEGAAFVTDDFTALVAEIEKTRGDPKIVVVDESGDVFTVGQRENHWLFTRGRHYAMLPVAIAQRMTMIAPNVRDNGTDLYVFRTSINDCKILADSYAQPELLQAAELNQGEFLHSRWQDGKRVLTKHSAFV